MKKYKRIIKKRLFLSIITSPIVILVYGISMYELYTLCKFGKMQNNIKILFICMLFFLACIIFFIVKAIIIKKTTPDSQKIIENYEVDNSGINIQEGEQSRVEFQDIKSFKVNKKYSFIVLSNKAILILDTKNKTSEEIGLMRETLKTNVEYHGIYKEVWTYVAIILIVFISLFYGGKIYKSAINYNGKLSWVLGDLKNKKTLKFEHNNIYEQGIEGIFTDINKEITMPKDLYISDNFTLNFDSNGIITSFDTYLYGKNDKGKLQSYLITYNREKSADITVILNGYVNAKYNEDKRLKPLIDTVKVISVKQTVSKWHENKYGILYYGMRSFGNNTDGIVYVNSNGTTKPATKASEEIKGYAVSVFVPGKENTDIPVRYILSESLENIRPKEFKDVSKKSSDNANEFYISNKVGYRLDVAASAAGSKSYSLNKTSDGGITWNAINDDPFCGSTGEASGISFLNDKLGFICISRNGGKEGMLYRTEDGGLSYKKVDFPKIDVKLDNGQKSDPFDLPEIPNEKDGKLNVLIGQGLDGDYNGACKALYQSKDQGRTWEYVKEVK
ncbi:WD40/YVTN/BNR-like repeat-containing protein [Inconstantimicrobium mannanitabidum]|uniref:Uncharacterized protein n=1 Tax=Inconstantimicrobium mannanitabidum TaxID=1604901 RepID=A0ACB5RE44_9CLOT|nr:hypothetical protein [Clostridium sp. TW13]GKX67548.1 hypothetical protein rsdtw13_28060 [Clostridium sp. TW13]